MNLSLRFHRYFPGGPWLAGDKISAFWILLDLRMMEKVVGYNWSYKTRRAKLQSNHHHQQTNIQLFTGRMPFLSPNKQCQSTERRNMSA